MQKKILLLLILLQCIVTSAQQKTFVTEGIITLKNNNTTGFEKLYFVGEKVAFKNVATNTQTVYLLTDIYTITDDNQQVVYKNGERQRIAEVKPAEVATEADTLFRPNYPEGIYITQQDFIAKKPTYKKELRAKGLIGFTKPLLTQIEHTCFFYDMADDKLTGVFAVSYKGHLYFQVQAILDNRNKTDRAQTSDFVNSFVRVIMGGNNYFYTEANLANAWAQGLAYNTAGGASLARTMVYGKGVVWDFKNSEFNIFKNCNDYNDFIQPLYAEGVQQCQNQQANIWDVRKAIGIIK